VGPYPTPRTSRAPILEPATYCPPRHRMPFNSINEGFTYVSMMRRAKGLAGMLATLYDINSLNKRGGQVRVDDVAGNSNSNMCTGRTGLLLAGEHGHAQRLRDAPAHHHAEEPQRRPGPPHRPGGKKRQRYFRLGVALPPEAQKDWCGLYGLYENVLVLVLPIFLSATLTV